MQRTRTTGAIKKEKKENEIGRQDLIDALTMVKPGLANNEIVEQSTHFIFGDDVVWTFNDAITITQPFETGLSGAVKAKEFYTLLGKIKDENLEKTSADGKIFLVGEDIEVEVLIDAEIKLQKVDVLGITSKKWMTLPEDFIPAISFCIFSASQNMIRPELTCLWINGDQVISCDGFRGTRRGIKAKVKEPFLIPAKAAAELVKYKPTKFYLGDKGWLHFSNKEKTIFSCRTVTDQEYPNTVLGMFDMTGDSVQIPKGFAETIDRAQVMVTADFALDRFVILTIKDKILTCTGKGAVGRFTEKTKIDYDGDDIEIKVHPNFLIQILSHLDEMIVGSHLLFNGKDFQHIISLSH